MAPKKEQPVGPQVDLNPFGAFINVAVDTATLDMVMPTERVPSATSTKPGTKAAEPTPPPGPPKTHISVSWPGSHAPTACNPTDPTDPGSYSYAFAGRSRREPTLEALHELINGAITIGIHDSTTGTLLATVPVDPLEFGVGASSLDLGIVNVIPEISVPQGCATVKSGTLHGVRLWLTHRNSPATDAPSDSRPSTSASQRPKGSAGKAGADTAAGTYPAESELPAPEPFSFFSPVESKGANVIDLQLTSIQPLPGNLAAVVTAATEGKAGGKVAFTCALATPAGPAVVLSWGALVTGTEAGDVVVFQPGRRRCCLTSQQADALRDMLEEGQPLRLEVARYLTSDTLADPAWEAYHAEAALPGTANLLRPGATATTSAPATLVPCSPGATSCIPAYVPPQGKAVKNMEEAPAAGICSWADAGSVVTGVQLSFARPLVPPWTPPTKPPAPLQALVPPTATLLPPHVQPTAAQQQFQQQVASMAQALTQLQMTGALPTGAEAVQQLAAQLEADGRLQQLQAAVKKQVVAVALEKLHGDLDGTPLAADQATRMLKQLQAELEVLLDQALGSSGSQPQPQPASELQQLLQVAAECEAVGDVQRAAQLHQQRVVLCLSGTSQGAEEAAGQVAEAAKQAEAWWEYACFCMRQGLHHRGRAEQAMRRALAVHPAHLSTLAGLTLLLLQEGRATDSLFLKEAATLAKQLISHPDATNRHAVLGWGLMLMTCQAAGDQAQAQDMAAALAAVQQAEAAGLEPHQDGYKLARGKDAADVNGLLAVAELAGQLALPEVALEALQQAAQELPNSCSTRSVASRIDIAAARAWSWHHLAAQAAAREAAATAAATAQHAQHLAHLASSAAAEASCTPDDAAAAAAAAASAADMEAGAAEAASAQAAAEHAKQVAEDAAHHVIFGHFQQDGTGGGTESYLLRGEVLYRTQQWREALTAFAFVVNRANWPGVRVPLKAYLSLAECYMQLEEPTEACNVYMKACLACPCATTWLGLSRVHEVLGEEAEAEAALAEAARCDPDNPAAWARIALTALRSGRPQEAGVHATSALRLGLHDLPLLMQLLEYGEDVAAPDEDLPRARLQGEVTRACLERATKQPDAPLDLRLRLAQICLDEDDVASARCQLEAATKAAEGDSEAEAKVNALVPRLLDAHARMFL